LIWLSIVFASNVYASNFKAQGYYYKAKSEYEAQRYSSAISYAEKSIAELHGANEELEYLLVLCYYKQKDWINAEKELNVYASTESNDKNVSVKEFDENVERLTGNEKKALAKLMVKIMESAEKESSYRTSSQYKIDQLMKKAARVFNDIVNKNRKRYADGDLVSKDTVTHIEGTRYKSKTLEYDGVDGKLSWKYEREFDLSDVVGVEMNFVEHPKRHPEYRISRMWLNTRKGMVKEHSYSYERNERDDGYENTVAVELKGRKDYLQGKVKELNGYFHQIAELSRK